VEVSLFSTHDDQGTVTLACQPETKAEQRVRVARGENAVRLRLSTAEQASTGDRHLLCEAPFGPLRPKVPVPFSGSSGTPRTLTARISGFRDTLAENNMAETHLTIRARPQVMLVENRPASGEHLAKALRAGGLSVESHKVQEVSDLLDSLKRLDAVVLINVPAASLSQRQMEALKQYVCQGGGLVVIGGDQAFTPGGYRRLALEEILPLVSEPTRKTARPSLAMVLVVDRSLSMEEGGAIELAREAMRRTVQLLQPDDQLGVLAFDEQTRWVSPIEPVGDKAKVLARIESITAGGRTDMAPAIAKAYLALHEAFAARKHMIVLTDGISHPADFEALAERVAREGITISTVALGKEASRPLLEDMARLGKGRFYACDAPQAVPSVFALETASASKVGIHEGPFFPQPAPGEGQHAPGTGLPTPQRALGAGLPTPPKDRPKVSEGGGDLRSQGRRGQETCTERSQETCAERSGPLAPSLLGYVQTRPKPEARVVLTSVAGDPLLAWCRYGEGTSVAFTSDVESRWAAAWLAWPDFGRFWTNVVRGAMRAEQSGPDSPAKVVSAPSSFSEEFRVRPTDHGLLRRIAATTGGVYEPEPESAWQVAAPGTLPPVPVHYYLLAAAAVLFVLDTAARRS
jgi:uncharacterized membrane protein